MRGAADVARALTILTLDRMPEFKEGLTLPKFSILIQPLQVFGIDKTL